MAKWAGLGACVLILLTALAGLKWHNMTYGDQGHFITVAGGAMELVWAKGASGGVARFYVGKPHPSWKAVVKLWSLYALWPQYTISSLGTLVVTVPLWIPFILVALPTALLWYRDRRHPPGHCANCGYNLHGLTEPRCPECGTRFTPHESAV